MTAAGRALVSSIRDRRWTELGDFVEAQLALLRAQYSLWTAPYGTLAARTIPQSPGAALENGPERALSERLARAVSRAARMGVFRPRCLARSIALSRLLTAHGVHGHHIRVGVRRDDAAFTAHAWVQLGDSIIGDNPARTSTFIPLTDLRSVGARFTA